MSQHIQFCEKPVTAFLRLKLFNTIGFEEAFWETDYFYLHLHSKQLQSKMSEIENKENVEIKKKKDKKSENKTNQTMLRSMFGNLVSLSNLADQKAALMISVNSILVSVIITFVFGNDGFNKNLLYPILFLLSICVLTIVFSIIATKPKLRSHVNSGQPIDLFFFQSFSSISSEAYQSQMKDLMNDENLLQDKILHNIHAQGKVLTRKYNQLKIAYTIFLVGFPVSVLLVVMKMLGWY